jgi:hypothetical protein
VRQVAETDATVLLLGETGPRQSLADTWKYDAVAIGYRDASTTVASSLNRAISGADGSGSVSRRRSAARSRS